MSYDAADDARKSYDLALEELRKEHRVELIGDATLILGDCTKIMPFLGLVDCVVTDPPYRVTSGGFGDLEGGFSGWIKDSYDNKGAIVDCDVDWSDWLPLIPRVLADASHVYIFSNDRNLQVARQEAESAGLVFHRLLIWDKRTALPNRWYQQTCEFVLFMRKGRAFKINDPSSKSLQSIFQRDESEHPTEKPVGLCEFYIRNSTDYGEVVLDPFMGSGTTGAAALRARRRFVGIESSERWFDVACERIEAANRQGDMFVPRPAEKPTQTSIFDEAAE